MIHEVPGADWCPFLEEFSRAHRAWLATIHVVDADGAVTRRTQVGLKSATYVVDAALFEFLDEGQSCCARRATALPEQLDGRAPGELSFSERSTGATATLTAATHPTAKSES